MTLQAAETACAVAGVGRLFLTGEGSSRIFPAKNVIAHARRCGWPLQLHTEGGRQAQEYNLADWAVFALSNSGRTAEVIELFTAQRDQGHSHLYSLTAFSNTKLQSLATRGYVLSCGEEGRRSRHQERDGTGPVLSRAAGIGRQHHAVGIATVGTGRPSGAGADAADRYRLDCDHRPGHDESTGRAATTAWRKN